MNGFGGERTGVFGSSATFMAGRELEQYFGVKAFVQNNCGLNKSLKDVENSAPSLIFGLSACDPNQIFIGIILTSTNVGAVSNQLAPRISFNLGPVYPSHQVVVFFVAHQ